MKNKILDILYMLLIPIHIIGMLACLVIVFCGIGVLSIAVVICAVLEPLTKNESYKNFLNSMKKIINIKVTKD